MIFSPKAKLVSIYFLLGAFVLGVVSTKYYSFYLICISSALSWKGSSVKLSLSSFQTSVSRTCSVLYWINLIIKILIYCLFLLLKKSQPSFVRLMKIVLTHLPFFIWYVFFLFYFVSKGNIPVVWGSNTSYKNCCSGWFMGQNTAWILVLRLTIKLAITNLFWIVSRNYSGSHWEPRTPFCLDFGLAENFEKWPQLAKPRIMEQLKYFHDIDNIALLCPSVFLLLLQFTLINIRKLVRIHLFVKISMYSFNYYHLEYKFCSVFPHSKFDFQLPWARMSCLFAQGLGEVHKLQVLLLTSVYGIGFYTVQGPTYSHCIIFFSLL